MLSWPVLPNNHLRATVCKNQAKLELLYTDQLKFSYFLGIYNVAFGRETPFSKENFFLATITKNLASKNNLEIWKP